MKYLILSDLHSNLEALRAALEGAAGNYDKVVCLGDLVGYGPNPDEVVDWVRASVEWIVRGNHDKACCGMDDAEEFNEVARAALLWTRARLKPENLEYLKNLPAGPVEIDNKFTILHGSPRDEDEYVTSSMEVAGLLELFRHRLTFFGHTHIQGGFSWNGRGMIQRLFGAVPQGQNSRRMHIKGFESYYLNPGSVGQPRDRDNRAAFAIYDTKGDGTVEFHRAPYNLEATVEKMRDAGLPDFLSHRLLVGK